MAGEGRGCGGVGGVAAAKVMCAQSSSSSRLKHCVSISFLFFFYDSCGGRWGVKWGEGLLEAPAGTFRETRMYSGINPVRCTASTLLTR